MQLIKRHHRVKVDNTDSVHAFTVEPYEVAGKPIIFSHGFSVDGTESYRLFILLAERFAAEGYPCVLFDYRGSGYSDLDFSQMTIDSEVSDLMAMIDFTKHQFRSSMVLLFGMSLGCAVAALTAAQRDDIGGLALWCLSSNLFARYSHKLGSEIRLKGYTFIDKGFKVGLPFLDSLKDKDIPFAIEQAKAPTLLIHGNKDDVAPIELSQQVKELYPTATLHEIVGGNHGFKLQDEQRKEAVDLTLVWLRRVQALN